VGGGWVERHEWSARDERGRSNGRRAAWGFQGSSGITGVEVLTSLGILELNDKAARQQGCG